jgi:hypothetical protein
VGVRAKPSQAAFFANRGFLADLLAVADEQGMVFVEQLLIGRQVAHE